MSVSHSETSSVIKTETFSDKMKTLMSFRGRYKEIVDGVHEPQGFSYKSVLLKTN